MTTSKKIGLAVFPNGNERWVEVERNDVHERRRVINAGPWSDRVYHNCFCCSCTPIYGGSMLQNDAACRMHGFAGKRPCELHGTAGKPWGGETKGTPSFGTMPSTVQQYRTENAAS